MVSMKRFVFYMRFQSPILAKIAKDEVSTRGDSLRATYCCDMITLRVASLFLLCELVPKANCFWDMFEGFSKLFCKLMQKLTQRLEPVASISIDYKLSIQSDM